MRLYTAVEMRPVRDGVHFARGWQAYRRQGRRHKVIAQVDRHEWQLPVTEDAST